MITAAASFDFQVALDSIAYGSLFALMALGLALLFGVMGLMNFAYGELIMAGGFTMYYTRSWGWVGMMLTVVGVVTVLSLLMELIAFRPVRRAAPVVLLITSFAVSYFLEALGWMTVGTGPQKGVQPYPWLNYQYSISGVRIARLTIVIWVVTVVLLVAMTLLLKKTTLGIQLRASTEDFRMAQLVGVRANWVIAAAFGITGLLASAVAILYVLRQGPAIDPNVGQGPLLIAFVGGVIGGLGSLAGAALGGFVLGAIINVLQAELPATGAHPLNNHTLVFAFFAVIAILVFQPEGLIALRAAPILRLWQRLRAKPAVAEGTGA
jgi:branched-chain amino acid transport system permease protein